MIGTLKIETTRMRKLLKSSPEAKVLLETFEKDFGDVEDPTGQPPAYFAGGVLNRYLNETMLAEEDKDELSLKDTLSNVKVLLEPIEEMLADLNVAEV